MTRQQFKENLTHLGCFVQDRDDKIHVYSKTSIYSDVITHIPENVIFTESSSEAEKVNIDLPNLSMIGNNVEFLNNGWVSLNMLKSCEGAKFFHNGKLFLNSLDNFDNNTVFQNNGDVYLNEIKTIPQNFRFNNDGDVYLGDFIEGEYVYDHKVVNFLEIGKYTMIVGRTRVIDEVTVYKAKIFGGGCVDNLKKCYAVKDDDGMYAHGNTIREAIIDLDYRKFMNFRDETSVEEVYEAILNDIEKTRYVTMAQYRILTGSCKSGCRSFMHIINLPEDNKGFILDDLVEILKDNRQTIKNMTKHGERDFLTMIPDTML